jgi:hypothetical protein
VSIVDVSRSARRVRLDPPNTGPEWLERCAMEHRFNETLYLLIGILAKFAKEEKVK